MKRRTFFSSLGASAATGWLADAAAPAAARPAAPPRFGDDRDGFHEKHFGMFVHWGLYSIPVWHHPNPGRHRELLRPEAGRPPAGTVPRRAEGREDRSLTGPRRFLRLEVTAP